MRNIFNCIFILFIGCQINNNTYLEQTNNQYLPVAENELNGKYLRYDIDSILYRIDWYSNGIKDSSEFFDIQNKKRYIPFMVDSLPQFISDTFDFQNFVDKNLEYPQANYSGWVLVGFIVEVDGSITHISVEKSLCRECDSNAIKVIKKLPLFKPAINDNKKVPYYMFLIIKYKN